MQPFRYHVLVCDQKKPDGSPCCSAQGSAAVLAELRMRVARAGLLDTVQITVSGSIGLCGRGPNMVVYPDGVWYSAVGPGDVAEIVSEHLAGGRPVARLLNADESALRAEIIGNRDKMMAAMRARDAAGAVPDEIALTIQGFRESRILLSALELDVFSHLGTPASASDVARTLGTDPRATEALLNALVAMALLTKHDGAYERTTVTARYLAEGGPDDSRLGLRHNVNLWESWSALTQCVRTGRPAPRTGTRDTDAFIGAMHKNAALRAPLVVATVGVDGVRRMIDIGGGSGAYSIAFARANPSLAVTVLDLEGVLPITRRHIDEAKLGDRVTTVAGDLTADAFGEGYDLALLSAICHMLGPEENQDLLRRTFAALVPKGRVVIQDHVMSDDKTSPRMGALFAINMLVNTEKGSTFSEREYATWLTKAGFVGVRRVALGGPNDLMIGERGA